jgi:hypothetical protein
MGKRKYTDDEKNRMVDAVDTIRSKEGLSLLDACKKAKVAPSLYQWWKGRREGKYQYKRAPTTSNEDLNKSISLAIGEMEQRPQSRPISGRRSLLKKLYTVKSALMDLERELVLDGIEEGSNLEQD